MRPFVKLQSLALIIFTISFLISNVYAEPLFFSDPETGFASQSTLDNPGTIASHNLVSESRTQINSNASQENTQAILRPGVFSILFFVLILLGLRNEKLDIHNKRRLIAQ